MDAMTSWVPSSAGGFRLGDMPAAEVLQQLGLPTLEGGQGSQLASESSINPFASILPLLAAGPRGEEKAEAKPSRQLIAKGLPPLPVKLVEKVQNLEFVEMEEFLPAPQSLRLTEQGKPNSSLRESLMGALTHFQAIQQQKVQRRIADIMTWIRCFTLYMAVIAKSRAEMVPMMVAHLHTVFKLHSKAPHSMAWLEYDVQFRMEAAASEDKTWSSVDTWQYISCLPGPGVEKDP